MSMIIACPNCDKTYNLPPDRLGKKARCNACRHVFVPQSADQIRRPVTQSVTQERMADSADDWTAPPHPQQYQQSSSWDFEEKSFAEATASVIAQSASDRFESVQPVAAQTVTASSPSPISRSETREVTMGRLALDRMTMTYAMQWWTLWAVTMCVSGVLAFYVTALIALPVMALASWICLVGAVGGIAHMAVQNVARGSIVHWSEGWGLFVRRGLSLALGSCLVGLGVVVCTAMLFGGVFAVSHLPYAGGPLGGLLVIPTFASILFLFVLTCNLHLVIVIIGVEDCTAWQALTRLAALVRRDWFALLGWTYVSPFLVTIGVTLVVALFTSAGLGGAITLCGGEQLLFMVVDGISLNNVLHALSASIVVAGALAFVTVFATLQFTVLYCRFA